MALKRSLTYFDMVAIVVGSIVGADIYIASSLTANMLGPAALLVWVVAGLCATVIALVFAYCSYYVPRVGGPFAFVSAAFDDFFGFLTGWSIWIAEVLSLPVFAIAFAQYLQFFVPLDTIGQILVKVAFILVLTTINIRGVKAAGRVNDVLTVIKLLPLVLLILAGIIFIIMNPSQFVGHYVPFAPLGFSQFGSALVLIFWAYVGFEIGTFPSAEVINPRKTVPRAIITGMMIVMVFYLSTNFIVYSILPWKTLAGSSTPLILAIQTTVIGGVGVVIMGIGALLSVSGSNESGTLGTARLSYAMAIDGLFPRFFAKTSKKYKTPYGALIIQGIIAFTLANLSTLSNLISFAVFNLAFAFLLTCLALIVLSRRITSEANTSCPTSASPSASSSCTPPPSPTCSSAWPSSSQASPSTSTFPPRPTSTTSKTSSSPKKPSSSATCDTKNTSSPTSSTSSTAPTTDSAETKNPTKHKPYIARPDFVSLHNGYNPTPRPLTGTHPRPHRSRSTAPTPHRRA